MIPIPCRWDACAAALAACYGIGYTQARHTAEVERAKVEAVAVAENSRFRKLEKEVADAQAGYVQAYIAARDASHTEWMRIRASVARGVPAIPTVCPSVGDAQNPGLASTGNALTAGEAADALSAGEELEGVLRLCQSELRQCAGLR